MFTEYKCGCIVGEATGRLRICATHRPERASGDGGVTTSFLRGIARLIPGYGVMPYSWDGGKRIGNVFYGDRP